MGQEVTGPTSEIAQRLDFVGLKIWPLRWDKNLRVGDYRILLTYGQGPQKHLLSRCSKVIGYFDTEDEAKVAADQDHMLCVHAALTPPDP